jgi:hypothetical protein
MNVVARSLFRIYRPVALWFWSIVTLVTVITTAVLAGVDEVGVSLWFLIAGQGMKWWLLILGVLLVAVHLKLYVANGVTRRDFLIGAGVFGGLSAVVFALMVPLGHGVERLVWTAFGTPPDSYPVFTAGAALREAGHLLPGALGSLVTGALIAAGFYRFDWRIGLLLILPGALPLVVADGLLGLYAAAEMPAPRLLPFAAGFVLSLAVTVLGALALRREMRDVTIRRTAG